MNYYKPSVYNSAPVVRRETLLPFENPAVLLAHYNEAILEGEVQVHDWQKLIHADFAREYGNGLQNDINLKAANGSGKSVMVVAPDAVWSAAMFPYAETVVTSASGSQLDKQTGRHIKTLAGDMNKKEGQEWWTIQNRKLVFGPSDGMIDFFATDEAGQAEGWHPRRTGSPLTLIVDEAKTVKDNIAVALDRCHDAQRYLKVSSTATDSGFFYRSCTGGMAKVYTVTVKDCPHIGKYQIDKIVAAYGEFSPITRSILWAEFASVSDEGIIPREAYLKCRSGSVLPYVENFFRIGVDLAAGGDETTVCIFKGNRQIALEAFVEKDTTATAQRIHNILLSYGVQPDGDNYKLNADDGGVGHGINDQIRNHGWTVRRILNNSPAFNKRVFLNRGAELYFNASSLITNHEIIPLDDPKQQQQLLGRKLDHSEQGRFRLEDKKKLKSRTGWSPDRADAFVLALAGLKAPFFTAGKELEPEEPTFDKFSDEFHKRCIEGFERDQLRMLKGLPPLANINKRKGRKYKQRPKAFINLYHNNL